MSRHHCLPRFHLPSTISPHIYQISEPRIHRHVVLSHMDYSLPLPLLFLHLFLYSFSAFPTRIHTRSLFLPLKTQQFRSPPFPNSPINRKLYFHRNVSLLVSLTAGSPPQDVSMVLDTGSELSWLLCSDTPTPPRSPSFHPRASTSYRPVTCTSSDCTTKTRDLPSPASCNASTNTCHVYTSYADGSAADGVLAIDAFRMGQSPSLGLTFGCMGSSYSSADASPATGLLGMNRGKLSLVSQMGTRRFSYCISEGDSTGVLLLGDAPLPFTLALNYTPFSHVSLPLPYFDRVAYSVQLEGIRVGGNLLPIPKSVLEPDHTGAGQTMVDSGTQFSFLLGPAYAALKAEFLRQTKGVLRPLDDPYFAFQVAFDLCYRLPAKGAELIPTLPEVTMVFQGAEVTVSGSRLLYRVPGIRRGGDDIWCLTFGNSDLVPMEAYVIGHHHQQNMWVEYDLERSRVGFAPLQCESATRKLPIVL